MKDGLRFVDCDMHIMEPPDLFERYLEPRFKSRVSLPDRRRRRARSAAPSSSTACPPPWTPSCSSIASGRRPARTNSTQPLSGSRLGRHRAARFRHRARSTTRWRRSWAWRWRAWTSPCSIPTSGLSLLARDNMDPHLSLALCQAYNNWIHEFCQHSPDQLKFVAMLPVHDVHLACRELLRCVRELGAVGSFMRPNLVNGHYWHSNYWDPLYSLHEEPGRHVGIPRGHGRVVLAHERAVRGEPLLPPRGQPLDRDAAGPDRHDHRRRLRVPSAAARGLPRSAELLGARPAVAHRVGLSRSTATRTRRT